MPWQPFHAVIDLPWEKAEAAMAGNASKAQAAATRSLRELLRKLRDTRRGPRGSGDEGSDRGVEVVAAGIVAGGGQNPAQIPNPHIRAHAAEGRLFRESAERAAQANGLTWRSFAQKSLYPTVAAELRYSVAALRSKVAALGAGRIKPWRGEEKEAAAAAWAALAGGG